MPRDKVVRLVDVAALADVSLATASKALNGRAEVADVTRQRVLAAADALHFVPNRLARSLSSRTTGTVGLLTASLDHRFVLPILEGAEDAFGSGSIDVFLCDSRGDAVREQHHLSSLMTRRVDGIIVVGDRTDERQSLGPQGAVPIVYAYAPSGDPADISLTPDNRQGGRLAVEHLLSLGRTRLAMVSGDVSYVAARDRVAGGVDALSAAGLTLLTEPLYSDWSEGWGRAAGALLADRYRDLDGIICGSDQVARGVLDALRDAGRRVPEDVAVVGYDNWDVLALGARPALTTVDANMEELGREAARQIFRAIAGDPAAPGSRKLPVRLIIRGSTLSAM